MRLSNDYFYEGRRKNDQKAAIGNRKSTYPCSSPKVGCRVCSITGENARYRFNGTETASFISNSKFWQKEFYLSNLDLLMTPDHSDIVT